jgi:creatinine amidohydrolase
MEKNNWGCYEQMRPDQIEPILEARPIAYLPWGALEYHSYHNPIGLDGIKAHGMCIDLAKRTGGIVLPPVYQASSTIKTYPGVDFKKHSLEFSEELLKMLCTEYFEQLVDEGFKIIVLLTGHAGEPHFEILKSVADTFNQRFADRHFWALAEFDVLSSDLLVANHSAIGETSLQLHYAPEMVAMDRLPQDREITLVKDGVSGDDPRPATKEFGAKIVEAFVENAGAKMDALIEQYL